MAEHRAGRARAQSVDVLDAVPAGQQRVDHRQALAVRVRPGAARDGEVRSSVQDFVTKRVLLWILLIFGVATVIVQVRSTLLTQPRRPAPDQSVI
ncbi:hypothetical protein GCM10009788_20230 [Nocardioides humi]|uniref:Uncharacterized protein n=1 Tax=Nocardioides humi TaxID=449461 RepID=A0ABN2ABQ6_9ACTN